jgi:hypothetical protein
VSGELVAVIEPDGVGALQPAHPQNQVGVGRFQDQMVMVAHQTKRVYLPSGLLARLGQSLDAIVPLDISQKNILALVAAAHDVVNRCRIFDAQGPWHAQRDWQGL